MSMLSLAFVLNVVDRASGRLKAIGDRIDKLTEPARKVRAKLNDMLGTGPLLRLRAGVDDAGNAFGRLAGLAQGVAAGVGLVAAGATAAFLGVKRIADQTDTLADDAARLGMTTQKLQELGFAAQMSGSSVEEMSSSLGFLSNNLVQAREGNQELVRWMARVGVTARDLRDPAFSVTDVLARMADTYQRVGKDGLNSAEMIAASRALMGRSGDRLNQLLRQGSAALRQYAAEARRLGVVLDEATVKNMADFNDEFDRTRLIMFGNLANALSPVMPVLKGIVERVGQWFIANRQLISTRLVEFIQRLEQALPAVLRGADQLATGLGTLISLLDSVAQSMGGWQNVITAITVLIGVKAIGSLVLMGHALWGVAAGLGGVTLAALPWIGIIGGIAVALGVAAAAIYSQWEPIKSFFLGLFDIFERFHKAVGEFAVNWLGPQGKIGSLFEPAGGSGAIQPQAAKVGGTLRVEVVGPGRVTGVERTPGSGMEIDAYSGPAMAGVAGF